jgi:pimeloyl-ACP methyl ester carboxylesterase
METYTETINEVEIYHKFAIINGITYHFAEAGKGPLLILVHGFPELWYSWRHQLPTLSKAGYRVVAPDLRGFGQTEGTDNLSDYSLFNYAKDIKELIDYLGNQNAVIVGHDWGANIGWLMPLIYPDKIKALIALSIPYYPQPRNPEEIKKWSQGKFSFPLYFEKRGAVEAEFEENPKEFFRKFFYGLSGNAPTGLIDTLFLKKPENAKLLDGIPEPAELPEWITDQDIDYYANTYSKKGISYALNFYRTTHLDYPRLKEAYQNKINKPVLFIAGASEAAIKFGSVEPMKHSLPKLDQIVLLSNCGHWIQQERATELNNYILEFLARIEEIEITA